MRRIGYSTGAIALSDFGKALKSLATLDTDAVELSALRISEIEPLISAIPNLSLETYSYVSIHLPSSFSASEEVKLFSLLQRVPKHWNLVMHPDSIHDFGLWRKLSSRVAIENMDRRKSCGRTATELRYYFGLLPEARLCFDIGHARQFDPSMAEAWLILTDFADRLVQVHVSEVDSQSRHALITYTASIAFRGVAHLIPPGVPLIVESRVSAGDVKSELQKVKQLFSAGSPTSRF